MCWWCWCWYYQIIKSLNHYASREFQVYIVIYPSFMLCPTFCTFTVCHIPLSNGKVSLCSESLGSASRRYVRSERKKMFYNLDSWVVVLALKAFQTSSWNFIFCSSKFRNRIRQFQTVQWCHESWQNDTKPNDITTLGNLTLNIINNSSITIKNT